MNELLAKAPLRFMPLVDFYSPEFKSHYITGLTYTLRNVNDYIDPEHPEKGRLCERLASCVERWLKENKVKILEYSPDEKRVTGTGFIT